MDINNSNSNLIRISERRGRKQPKGRPIKVNRPRDSAPIEARIRELELRLEDSIQKIAVAIDDLDEAVERLTLRQNTTVTLLKRLAERLSGKE